MRLASLVAASLVISLPAIAFAQGMDVPGAAAPTAAPAAAPQAPAVAPAPASPAAAPAPAEPAPAAPVVAAPAAAPPGPAAPAVVGAPLAPKPQKSGGYVGFSVVTGQGTVYLNGDSGKINDALKLIGDSGSSPTTLGLMLRLGWGDGDFLFGTQFNWIRSYTQVLGTEAGYDFRAFDLTATWWSQEAGLYTRVGVGPAQYRVYAGSSESDPVSGVELMFGVGFTMGAFGVGIDYTRQSYDASEAGFDSVGYLLASLSLDLY